MAADMAVKAPNPPVAAPIPYVNWTGCYLGGQAGGAWTQTSHTMNDGRIQSENFDFDSSSWIAGGHFGCQYQFNRQWLVGAEGTWSAMDFDQMDHSMITPSDMRHFRDDQIATAVGKVGYTWDRFMIYGVGGYAAAHIDTSAFEPGPNAWSDADQWRSGVTAGGGIDYMPWQGWVFGIRGDWYDFHFDHSTMDSTNVMNTWSNSHADVFSVTGRISYLFNFGGPPAPVVSSRY
jgi:outer membrane immunogenic protein